MKIINVNRVVEVNFYIETDDKQFPLFMRSEGGTWMNLMGESWESCYSSEEKLEQAYQEFISKGAI